MSVQENEVKMVVLDQFYQIAEKPTKQVSFFWKVSHLVFFGGIAVCGFLTSFAFGRILDNFNYYCPLSAKIVFSNDTYLNVTLNGHIRALHAIDTTFTMWGSNTDCQFCQFTPLFTMLSAIIWGSFFLIITRGGGGYDTDLLMRPWAVVYPCVFFTIIMFIIYAISIFKLTRGLEAFCKQFNSQFGNENCVHDIGIYSAQFHDSSETRIWSNFVLYQKMTVISSHLGTFMWAIQLCLLIVRIVQMVDFDLYIVTLLPKEEEMLEKITDPQNDEEVTSLV